MTIYSNQCEKHVFRTTLKSSSLGMLKDHPVMAIIPYQWELNWSHLGETIVGTLVREDDTSRTW